MWWIHMYTRYDQCHRICQIAQDNGEICSTCHCKLFPTTIYSPLQMHHTQDPTNLETQGWFWYTWYLRAELSLRCQKPLSHHHLFSPHPRSNQWKLMKSKVDFTQMLKATLPPLPILLQMVCCSLHPRSKESKVNFGTHGIFLWPLYHSDFNKRKPHI